MYYTNCGNTDPHNHHAYQVGNEYLECAGIPTRDDYYGAAAEAHAVIARKPRMIDAITGDDLLTALADITPDNRYRALEGMGVRILREAADLCGVDSEGMTKRQAIMAIVTNF
jgi:hypothetical protein